MADLTSSYIEDTLRSWRKITLADLPENRKNSFMSLAEKEGIELREAVTYSFQVPRFEPPSLQLACPFCRGPLELRIHCDSLRKCEWCDAFICVGLDLKNQTYVPWAIAKLPSTHFSFGGFPFWIGKYWYLKETLEVAERWKSPLRFDRFKELVSEAEEKLKVELARVGSGG